MYLATKTRRDQAFDELNTLTTMGIDENLKAAIKKMFDTKDKVGLSNIAAKELMQALKKAKASGEAKKAISVAESKADLYPKKSQ